MCKAYFYYEVAEENQQEYLEFVSKELKPFFELQGARSYNIYQETNPDSPTTFIAEMVFDDLDSMQKTMGQHGKDPVYDAMVNRFFGFTSDPGVKPLGRYVKLI